MLFQALTHQNSPFALAQGEVNPSCQFTVDICLARFCPRRRSQPINISSASYSFAASHRITLAIFADGEKDRKLHSAHVTVRSSSAQGTRELLGSRNGGGLSSAGSGTTALHSLSHSKVALLLRFAMSIASTISLTHADSSSP